MLIVLDPGHGGRDPGAVAYALKEKDITLVLAQRAAFLLSAYEAEVLLTRYGDDDVDLSARADLANQKQADFFCSLHVNAGGGTGFESYIHPAAAPRTKALAQVVHAELARFYLQRGLPDRGLKRANFAVLRETNMPAVLLENLFIDHPRDAAFLADGTFLQDLAASLAFALVKALGLKERSTWDPAGEIRRLKGRGLITVDHDPQAPVTWGELATVLNRVLDRFGERG
ncbi:N-acetylmuramoyl-L-alanine amidase [Desulfovirgula thermocuniculi]|uniref:N-acetylmuramoyl-L-alanine amidase n=1 Tax=Desulfovirgula thermocuniculi TaxID=348842 RepID=UPI0003FA957C|nr:N-acetylmuramoyl-L-alanine amidase [Desulfovirgula thermocuniculi]